MNAFVRVLPTLEKAGGKLFFDCPDCEILHGVSVEVDGPPCWSWNGSVDKPTFHPSILYHYPWRLLEDGERGQVVCRSFVIDNHIRFLNDCAYHLAGQTVDLPQLEDDEWPGSAVGSP